MGSGVTLGKQKVGCFSYALSSISGEVDFDLDLTPNLCASKLILGGRNFLGMGPSNLFGSSAFPYEPITFV